MYVGACTVGMPEITEELHGGRHERVVLGKLEFGGEDTSLVRCAFGALDHGFPDEQVILIDGAGRDAIGRIGGQVFVFLKEPLGRDRVHCWRGTESNRDSAVRLYQGVYKDVEITAILGK